MSIAEIPSLGRFVGEENFGRANRGCATVGLTILRELPRAIERKLGLRVSIIIEGGSQDDWHPHLWAVEEAVISKRCNQLLTMGGSYVLDLVGRWSEEGKEEILVEQPKKTVKEKIDFKGPIKFVIPVTVITSDGRIFTDLEVHQDKVKPRNQLRLGDWLSFLHECCGDLNPAKNPHLIEQAEKARV